MRVPSSFVFLTSTFVAFSVGASNAFQHVAFERKQLGVSPSALKPKGLYSEASVRSPYFYDGNDAPKLFYKERVQSSSSIATGSNGRSVSSKMVWTVAALAPILLTFLVHRLPYAPSIGGVSSLAVSALEAYKMSMLRHPLYTKVATGATLAVLGDAMAQKRELGSQYDTNRAISFAAFDSCYRTFQHIMFPTIVSSCQGRLLGGILSSLPAVTVSGNTQLFLAALERTLAYQMLVIPLFYYPVFFTFTGLMQGLSVKEMLQRAKANFLPCWKKNLMFWIPIQLVMFGLVPENWQIPFVCVMGILWSTILSVTAGKAKK